MMKLSQSCCSIEGLRCPNDVRSWGGGEVNVIDRDCERQGFVRKFFGAQATNLRKYASIALAKEKVPRAVSPAMVQS